MSRTYKIEVVSCGDRYLAFLKVRKFLFYWELVTFSTEEVMPYSQWVVDKQKLYNIPDKRVYMYLNNTLPPTT